MAGEIPPCSGGQHKVNSSSSSNDWRIMQEEFLNNICEQTGEEFSPQFLRGRGGAKELNEKDGDPRKIVDRNQGLVHEDLTGITGLRIDSECGSDWFAARRRSAEAGIAAHHYNTTADYCLSQQGPRNIVDIRCVDQSTLPSHQYGSGSPDTSSVKIKLLCSFGGKIVPRQTDGKLRYFGGETRIISIRNNIIFEELMRKTYTMSKYSHTIKYQLPGEDLDALVSVMSDEDLRHMIDEYHGVEAGSHRLRIFLVHSNEHLVPYNEHETDIKKQDDGNSDYVVPTNDISHTSLKNCPSGKNLENQASDLGDISKSQPTFSTNSPMTPRYFEVNSNLDASSSGRVIPLMDVFQPSAWPFLQTSVSSASKELYQRPLCDDHLLRNSGGNVCHYEISCCKRSSSGNYIDNNHHSVPEASATYNQNCNMLNGSSQHGQKGRDFENQTTHPSICYPQKCLLHPECIRGFGSGDTNKRLSHTFSDSQLQQNQHRKYLFEDMLHGSAATYVPSSDLSGGPEWSMQHEYVDKRLESVCQNQPPIDLREVTERLNENTSKVCPSMKFGGVIDHSAPENALNHKNAPSCEPDSNLSFKDIKTIESQDISLQEPQGNTSACLSPIGNLNSLYEGQHTGNDANIGGLQRNSSQESPIIQSHSCCSHASNPVLDLPKNESAMLESSTEKCDNYHMHQVKKTDTRFLKSRSLGINHSSNTIILESTIIEDVTGGLPFGTLSSSQFDENNPGATPHEIHSHICTKFPSSSLDSSCQNVEDNEVGDSITDTSMAEIEAGVYGLQIIKNDDLEEMEELGSGTYGTVYHAKWRGTDVAIKRIKKSCFTTKPSDTNRLTKDFWREAQILSTLHHPNVVAFYGVVPDGPGGTLATVTEFMVNGSLKHALRKKDYTLNHRKRLMIAMDAAFGMEYLHLKNIVHFDLKCDNLLVNLKDHQRPICKVGDFGLSRIKQNTLISGGVRGTLPWMAPELLNNHGNRVSEKVDVFSFGIAMWELLTGQEPYVDMHCGAIIGGIVNDTLRPPVPQSCDSDWRRLMEECWLTNPVARPSFTDITKRLRAMSAAPYMKNHDGHM